MNAPSNSLIQTLDNSIETFAQIRSSDSSCVAAFDTLKQARAMIARAMQDERSYGSFNQPASAGFISNAATNR